MTGGLILGLSRVRTLEEVIQLAANSTAAGRPVGVYIETKGPTYHDGIGLPLESKLAAAVVAAWSMADVPVILQSFEVQVSRLPAYGQVLRISFMARSCICDIQLLIKGLHAIQHASLLVAWPNSAVRLWLQSCAHESHMCVMQSLEKVSRELGSRGFGARAKFIWLLDCDSSITDTELDHFANFGYGIGPDKVRHASSTASIH